MQIGETLGDYQILEVLGQGGEGKVFRVEHLITRRQEAIKMLARASGSRPDLMQRFLREIRVQASLNHPQIAAVHNAFTIGEELFMVMELVEGLPLAIRMDRQPLHWLEAVRILCQVLSALSYAHSSGVVHRDVTPSNIVIGEAGNIKLTDFGLAWAQADTRVTLSGSVLGSVHYMAPEQIRNASAADALSDIYSCGVVLYEAVAGRKPFEASNAFEIMQAHVLEQPLPPSSFNPEIPPALEQAILQAMSKDPAARQPSAGDFLSQLAAVVVSQESRPKAIAPKPRPVAPLKPNPRIRFTRKAAALFAFALALSVLATAAIHFRRSPAPENNIAIEAPPPPPPPLLQPVSPVPALSIPAKPAPKRPAEKPVRPSFTANGVYPANNLSPAPPPPVLDPLTPQGVSSAFEQPPPHTQSSPSLATLPQVPAHVADPIDTPEPPKSRLGSFFGKVKRLNPLRKRKPDQPAEKKP